MYIIYTIHTHNVENNILSKFISVHNPEAITIDTIILLHNRIACSTKTKLLHTFFNKQKSKLIDFISQQFFTVYLNEHLSVYTVHI